MINDKNLKQEGGEKSTNLQGQNVNIYNGISYSDAKEIFKDLFSSNFLQLKYEAADLAQARAEEITEKFLDKLNSKSPESISQFKEPAMQDALFTTQKEFAKSGDQDLGDLLVDILIDRVQTKTRNRRFQIKSPLMMCNLTNKHSKRTKFVHKTRSIYHLTIN